MLWEGDERPSVLGSSERLTILPCAGVDHGGSITHHPTTPILRRTDQSASSTHEVVRIPTSLAIMVNRAAGKFDSMVAT